ncbi:MAG TPA: hydroxyphenylacetyl-CoA thioesterase PaaI [Dinghuibacter sp.]|jgi:acyl-CoA thioesterase|uniref:hydroxyphenylacetyl-CoA thioesterase PaaI n=1 Tax=Dinghuibacter sp. TaxID=2024697 RepID=UPI002BE12AA6|nr:hydroxyphenylacetyl-CoA thioesterase PaaI [Dinghuibacter sp.]HTJ14100.1 hydroxyphenylacetyl-CoA thioesterase PaaI [Dinghuibacter sp.]
MTPQDVLQTMLAHDRFTEWLGLRIEEHREGYCRLRYRIREDMVNGFHSAHGGVLFAAADSAFAFACNSHGFITVALECAISFMRPAGVGEWLTVEATEVYLGNKTGVYDIRTVNEKGELVALFKGTGYRTSKPVA